MFFNRPLRDALPAHRRSFAPEWQQKAYILEKRARRAKDIQIEHYNRTAHALQPFSIGDHVIVQHPISKCWATQKSAQIVIISSRNCSTPNLQMLGNSEIGPNRDYIVKTPAGRLFRQNHRMLRKRVPVMPGNSTPGPYIQAAPNNPPPQEENPFGLNQPNATTRRTRGKAKVYTNLAPRRSTRKKERPARYSD
ncbi:hypothetical protein GHT06_006356 [Daphnia sinensis]|uniref:Uncharacterized protein n=1 Tax=Daphnia sinensis TaxID=1820382 RepID=A0AAD5KDW9_9CRUS|nr:hypothetical protein GHT06_006356 [Daphnia sinensis]